MFKTNDKIYTDEDIYVQGEGLAFSAFKSYTVYSTDDLNDLNELETILIAENGMLHKLNKVGHMFMLAH